MDQSWPNRQQGGVPQHAIPMGAFRQGNNPTMERAISSGDKVQFERLRRRTRVSESSGAEEEWLNTSMEPSGSYGQSPTFHTMHAEGNLYSRSPFEHAEENYKRWLASNTNGAQSASPRSPTTRGYITFQSRRSRTQQQDQGHHVTTVKASGTPHRLITRGRNRTSSETEQGGKGSRGPTQRKRGFSETESRPRWDKYGTSYTGNGRDMITNMSGLQCLASENIWFDKHRYDEAERRFYEGVNGPSQQDGEVNAILQDIAKSRQNILQSLNGVKSTLQHAKGRQQKRQHRNSSSHAGGDQELVSRMKSMELENQTLHKVVAEMRAALLKLESRVAVLEKNPAAVPCAKAVTVQAAPAKQVKVENGGDDEDDDIDLFGSDDEDEEAARIKQERLDAYAAKKSKKPALIAKSSILLDVKPWDDETDMAKLEECVRSVQMDGLLWGASKLVPVGYGIKKLQINCVVEDDKVGTDILEEEITKFEDYVQSVDVAAFNKI